MEFPKELKYTKDHEWLRIEGGIAYVGSTATGETIEYVTISTPSNGIDFGDLTASRNHGSATSGN